MFAALDITQPGALLIATIALWAIDAHLRARRARSLRPAVAAGAAVVAAVVLGACGAVIADVALLVLALVGGLRLLVSLTRLDMRFPTGLRGAYALRALALLVLLILVARPVCRRTEFAWQRPVLAVLLDHSGSMAVRDPGPDGGTLPSRTERFAAAVRDASGTIRTLSERFDMRVFAFRARAEATDDWAITSAGGLTSLSAALHSAGELRSETLEAPAAVVLVTDGAETVADTAAVRAAAADLAGRQIPLLIAGVGPIGDASPLIEIEPLAAPPTVRVRDLLRLDVAFRAQGCRGHALRLELVWNDRVAESATVQIENSPARIERAIELAPPGPGAQRLTARVTLPPALGETTFAESTVVEVTDERVRVLIVERAPQTESAFIARALSGDTRFETARRFLFDARSGSMARSIEAEAWSGFDVVILGRIGSDLPPTALDALAQAVERRRVGVALVGGRELLAARQYLESALASLSPAALVSQPASTELEVAFEPTTDGERHPMLAGLAGWSALPPLRVGVSLGETKPAAVVLARGPDGAPLLVAQNYGGGRTLAATWESTWPWSLASDAGAELHKRFWRQLVAWLANRQPQAWIIADQGEYPLAALASGDRHVRISAGFSGGDASQQASRAFVAQIAIRPAGGGDDAWQPLAARAGENRWAAEWPAPGAGRAAAAGDYELRLRLAGAGEPNALTATTRFSVLADDLERRPPTANLALLRELAKQGASPGSRYVDIADLGGLLEPLASEDRRRRIASVQRDDVVATRAGLLLAIVSATLTLEWIVRRRAGAA